MKEFGIQSTRVYRSDWNSQMLKQKQKCTNESKNNGDAHKPEKLDA